MEFRKEHFKHKLEKGKNPGKTFILIGLPVVIATMAMQTIRYCITIQESPQSL